MNSARRRRTRPMPAEPSAPPGGLRSATTVSSGVRRGRQLDAWVSTYTGKAHGDFASIRSDVETLTGH